MSESSLDSENEAAQEPIGSHKPLVMAALIPAPTSASILPEDALLAGVGNVETKPDPLRPNFAGSPSEHKINDCSDLDLASAPLATYIEADIGESFPAITRSVGWQYCPDANSDASSQSHNLFDDWSDRTTLDDPVENPALDEFAPTTFDCEDSPYVALAAYDPLEDAYDPLEHAYDPLEHAYDPLENAWVTGATEFVSAMVITGRQS